MDAGRSARDISALGQILTLYLKAELKSYACDLRDIIYVMPCLCYAYRLLYPIAYALKAYPQHPIAHTQTHMHSRHQHYHRSYH